MSKLIVSGCRRCAAVNQLGPSQDGTMRSFLMRRVLSVMILALIMMMVPALAMGQESGSSEAGSDSGDTPQSRIVVKSQKKKQLTK